MELYNLKYIEDLTNGPTGPTGPAGTTPAIQSILTANDGIVPVAPGSLVDLGTVVNSTGTAFTYTAPNTVTIEEAGTYLINFSSVIYNTSEATPGDTGASLQINGIVIPTASEYIVTQTSAFSTELQHNYNASAGDEITIENGSTVSNSYHDSTLSIIKLV